MELDSKQKRQRVLYEIRDFLAGAAFPLMLQLVLSATVILYADYNEEPLVQALSLIAGEVMLMAAYFIFGRQNGISAYRKYTVNQKKRELQVKDVKLYYKTGEYALWKGFAIGAVSVIPFMLFQFIECLAPNSVCSFVLKYAFGWAVYPFTVAGLKNEWLNFVWVIVPTCVHAAAYYYGGYSERKRQALAAKAQEIKDKKKK